MEYSFVQFGSTVVTVSSPNISYTPNPLTIGWGEKQKKVLMVHCSAIMKTSLSYQHCLQHNLEPSLIF